MRGIGPGGSALQPGRSRSHVHGHCRDWHREAVHFFGALFEASAQELLRFNLRDLVDTLWVMTEAGILSTKAAVVAVAELLFAQQELLAAESTVALDSGRAGQHRAGARGHCHNRRGASLRPAGASRRGVHGRHSFRAGQAANVQVLAALAAVTERGDGRIR